MSKCKQTTIKEVAQEAGVSIATVSRVLNGQSGVSKELAEQVKEIVRKMNYQPNAIARALKNSESRSIGLIIPDIENPFFPALVRGVEDAAQKNGYAVILCNTDGEPQQEEKYIKFLLSKQVDGILFVGNLDFQEHSSWLSLLPVPVVLLDRRIEGAPYSTVLIDNEMGAFLAVEHLIKQGRQQIAIIGGKPQSSTSRERVRGARRALALYGHTDQEEGYFDGYFTFDGGYQATRNLLASRYDFDAVFAANDMMAIGAIECLVNHGRNVPQEVAVAGFDDIKMAEWYKPSLTTVRQPVYKMGQLAVKSMVQQLTGVMAGPCDMVLKPELIVRKSSGRKGDLQ